MDELMGTTYTFDSSSEPPNPKKARRPPNAFLLYCLENRQARREQHPDKPNVMISQILADEWRAMDDEQKRPYKESAKIAQDNFKLENPQYRYTRTKRKEGAEVETHIMRDFYDINTLANLEPQELRTYILIMQSQAFIGADPMAGSTGMDSAQSQIYADHYMDQTGVYGTQ